MERSSILYPEEGMTVTGEMDGALRHSITLYFDSISLVKGRRLLLDKASGIVRGGRFTALISSCGGRGDYHLLSLLAAQQDPTSGLIIANGTLVSSEQYRRHCALIDDEMTVLDRLTVRQNLIYGTKMRVQSTSRDHEARLEAAVELMKLSNHLNRQVLACSLYVRRRVGIARELMRYPAAVFVDSAVEGLATHEARELLALLRNVAASTGCVVVASMLQPRWALLELSDDAIVIENTSIVYVGPSTGLLDIAASLLSLTRPSPPQLAAAGRDAGTHAPETCLNSLYRVASNPNTNIVSVASPSAREKLDQVNNEVSEIMTKFASGELPLLRIPFPAVTPFKIWKFYILCTYGLIQVWNRALVHVLGLVFLLLPAVLVGVLYERQSSDQQVGMQNRVGILFFLISSTFLHNLLFLDHTRRSYLSFQRHRAHNYYDCFTYLMYWVTTNLVLRFSGCLAFIGIVYLLAHLRSEVDLTSLQSLVAIMASTSFATSSVVWLVCCIVPTVRLAHYALFALYAFNTILAGIVLNVNTLPAPFKELSYASFIRLGYEAAVVSEFDGKEFGCNSTVARNPSSVLDTFTAHSSSLDVSIEPVASNHTCFTGDSYMHFLGFEKSRQWLNMALMAYITIGVIVLSLLAMWRGKAR